VNGKSKAGSRREAGWFQIHFPFAFRAAWRFNHPR
jgi:hypothetical protein